MQHVKIGKEGVETFAAKRNKFGFAAVNPLMRRAFPFVSSNSNGLLFLSFLIIIITICSCMRLNPSFI